MPTNPYTGLWSRLEPFAASDLGTLLVEREVVRIASIRGTIHVLTADDCLAFWPLFRPVFDRGLAAHPEVGPALVDVDLAPVLKWARALLSNEPLALPGLRAALGERFPEHDAAALAFACRNHLALVQVPPRGLLGRSHQVTVTTAEAWLGRRHGDLVRAPEEPSRRYLHEREVVPAGECESGCVVSGEAPAERCAQGRQGERLLAQQRPRPVQHGRRRPHTLKGGANLGMGRELAIEDGPEQAARTRGSRWRSGGGSCRGSMRSGRRRGRRAVLPRSVGLERLEPRPEPGVRVRRHLRLKPDEVVHCRQWVERCSRQQVLALQRRSVERPCVERVRHARTLARTPNAENRQNQAPTDAPVSAPSADHGHAVSVSAATSGPTSFRQALSGGPRAVGIRVLGRTVYRRLEWLELRIDGAIAGHRAARA